MPNTPAKKTRAELLKDINEIREQVRKDAPIWDAHARRNQPVDGGTRAVQGLLVGLITGLLIGFTIGGGCHAHISIKSTPNAPSPTDSRPTDPRV